MNIYLKEKSLEKEKKAVGTELQFEQERMIEAILFASEEPLSLKEISKRMPKSIDSKTVLESVKMSWETI